MPAKILLAMIVLSPFPVAASIAAAPYDVRQKTHWFLPIIFSAEKNDVVAHEAAKPTA